MERTIRCITHSDLDGLAAAAVIKAQYPGVQIMVTNYNKPRNLYKFGFNELIFVTDFTLTFDEYMILIRNKNSTVIWIDHHKKNYDEIEPKLNRENIMLDGLRRDDYCGAALAWMYLHPNLPADAMPDAIKLVNDYDLWMFKDKRTKSFSYGMGLWENRPSIPLGADLWNDLLSGSSKRLPTIVTYGKQVQDYIERLYSVFTADLPYYTEIQQPDGVKKILAMPVRTGNSSIFEKMDTDKIDATFTGQYVANIGLFRCSMYSPDNEKIILPIVSYFGGGGHPKAAGFSAKQYPLPLPPLKEPVPLEKAVKPYKELYDLRKTSIVVRQYSAKSDMINTRSIALHTRLWHLTCIAMNHPYLQSMLSVLPSATDCINPETNEPANIYLSWVLTNTGWYRCCAMPTDNRTSLENIEETVRQTDPSKLGEIKVIDGCVWWYTQEIPVKLFIAPTSITQ